MITDKSPDRIAQLGQTIADAAGELETIFLELEREADAQLAAAAGNFIIEHARLRPVHASNADSKVALLKAAVAASNITDLVLRSTTLRAKCDWWRNVLSGSRQQAEDVRRVCAQTPKVWRDDAPSAPVDDAPAENERHPGSVWIDEHYGELPVGEWVAAGKDGLVAHDPSPETLNTRVADAGLTPDKVAIAYIEAPGPELRRQ